MLTGYVVQINVLGLWHTDEYDGKDEKENGGETPEAAVEAKEVLQVGEDLQHGEGEDCGDRPDETFATGTRVVWEKFRGEEIRNCLDAQLETEHLNRKKNKFGFGIWDANDQGGRSCAGARGAPAEKFGLGRKF